MDHPAVEAFLQDVARRPWITDVWLYGSLAAGDHHPGASDIDLVALTSRVPIGAGGGARRAHRLLVLGGAPPVAPRLAHHAWHDTRRTIAEQVET